ncbi:MAG: WD40/YVTN/BNR-like repeat-containing protein [Acidimicrobiales bacterium]
MTRRAAALATACALVVSACTGGDAGSGERPSTVPTPTALDDDTFITAPPLETELVDAADRMTWSTLEMGAGGFVTGGDTDAAGETLLMRTDVGGLYRRDGEVWTQLLHLERVDDPQLGDWQVASAVVAPSDPSRLYAATGNSLRGAEGRILVSDDRGETWSSGAQRFVIDGNAEWRTGGERLAVDPTDPDEVWFGSRTEGLWRSADAGQTFSQVEDVPVGINDGTPAGVLWVIAAPDGATVFAGVAGDGVWQTTDDGAAWTRLWETPGLPMDASLGSDGRLWVAERDPGAVRSVMDGVITTHEPQSGRRWEVVEVDPADPDVVLVADVGIADHVYRTTDGGADWSRLDLTTSCPEIPWLDAYANDFLPSGSFVFDRTTAGHVWVPEGFGVWRVDLEGDEFAMRCDTAGIEELVSNDVVALPGGESVTAHWDRALFHHTGDGVLDATQGPTSRFNTAWDVAVQADDPTFLAAVVGDQRFCCEGDGQAYHSGYSTDGGRTWTRFASYDGDHPEELRFGNIAVATGDPDTMVWLPSFNGALHVTHDRGASWQRIVLPGTEDMLQADNGVYRGGSHQAYYLNRKVLVADPHVAGRFLLYHQELGLFRSDDGGDSWVNVGGDDLPTGWTVGWFAASLVASPFDPDHLLFAPGYLDEAAVPMYESTDGGSTWRAIPGTSAITALAVGPGETAGGPAIVYAAGEVGGQVGIWRSVDGLESWELLSAAPNGNYQAVKALAAAPDEPGTIYVGFTGTSFMVGRLAPKED